MHTCAQMAAPSAKTTRPKSGRVISPLSVPGNHVVCGDVVARRPNVLHTLGVQRSETIFNETWYSTILHMTKASSMQNLGCW